MADLRDGIFHKLGRARELRAEVQDLIDAHLTMAAAHSVIEVETSADHRTFRYFIREVHPPPPRIAVMTGEVLQHARTLLDYLAWALVLENGKTPTWRTQFPICSEKDAYEMQLKQHRLDGVSASALARIERLQPFQQPDPKKSTLQILQKLNAWDKHSELPIIITVAAIGPDIYLNAGIVETIIRPASVQFQDGLAQILEFGLNQSCEEFAPSFKPMIGLRIDLPNLSEPLLLQEVLTKTLDRVAQIVDDFDAEFA